MNITPPLAEQVSLLIQSRRSVKPNDMKDDQVPTDIIEQLLANANWAPCHGLTQPWRFRVYRGQSLVTLGKQLAQCYQDLTDGKNFKVHKYQDLLIKPTQVGCVILICMQRQTSEKIPEIEEIEAVACAVQNLHLSAFSYGLGGFWSSPSMIYHEKFADYFNFSEAERCLGVFYLGYPNRPWPASQREDMEDRVLWFG